MFFSMSLTTMTCFFYLTNLILQSYVSSFPTPNNSTMKDNYYREFKQGAEHKQSFSSNEVNSFVLYS